MDKYIPPPLDDKGIEKHMEDRIGPAKAMRKDTEELEGKEVKSKMWQIIGEYLSNNSK